MKHTIKFLILMITQQIIEKLGSSTGVLLLYFLCLIVYLFGNMGSFL